MGRPVTDLLHTKPFCSVGETAYDFETYEEDATRCLQTVLFVYYVLTLVYVI